MVPRGRLELPTHGFSDVASETLEKISTAPTVRHAVIGYAQGTPLRNEIEERDNAALELVTDRATELIVAKFGDGPISAKMRAHVVVA